VKRAMLVLTAFLLCAGPVSAQATRTWVSGVGDDANPCSRTAPCKTFAGAISKTAAHGVISVLDPGGYGAVTITKPITIDGGGMEGSILASLTNGVNIASLAAGDIVTLRNLTIQGTNNGLVGIRVTGTVGSVHVENCAISDFTRQGIDFSPTSGILYVTNTKIQNTLQAAVYVYHRQAVLKNVQLEGNVVGVQATTGSWVSVSDSSATGSTYAGLMADTGSILDVSRSLVAQNVHGLLVLTAGEIVAHETTVVGNTYVGIGNDGTGYMVSTGKNVVLNNINGSFTSILNLQ
jgi:hypothetical protein